MQVFSVVQHYILYISFIINVLDMNIKCEFLRVVNEM